jgi:preprotein translocase subunit SecF
LSVRFSIGGFANGIKYGICAIGATLHDVLVILGIFAILGYLLKWQVDTLFVTAVLTIIGFSTHDTIVVFDRIRENLRHKVRGEGYEELTNKSILQTFTRSINTSFGVVMMLVTLIAFGGPIIQHFYITFLIGIISGTYSSIFNAAPLLVVWDNITAKSKASTTNKPSEGKAFVTPTRVKEMKPLVEKTTTKSEDTDEEITSTTERSDRAKVKPKKKRRY